ncbi:hypothetical protein ACQKGC_24810 [Allorhizobium pseudoryzae]|uniref:hypothetical protein n=1 Tax=Allorhizobium pseudoryzae TaxID=379684 RepID=UPI003D09287C
MSTALDMFTTARSERITDEGRKAASHFAASQLASALQAQNVFKPWEIQAIVSAYSYVVRKDGHVTEDALTNALHAQSIPKDLAGPIARALSRAK